jgi:hypothetical protein
MNHVIQPMETFPSIAEKYGHPGEWLVIAVLNPPASQDLPPMDPGSPLIGAELVLPDTWDPDYVIPVRSTRSASGSSSASSSTK